MKLDLKILNAKILVTINKFNFNFDFIIIKIIIQFKMFKLFKKFFIKVEMLCHFILNQHLIHFLPMNYYYLCCYYYYYYYYLN